MEKSSVWIEPLNRTDEMLYLQIKNLRLKLQAFKIESTIRSKTAAFLIILFFPLIASAQTGWFWQNPMPHGNKLSSVYFVDINTGWTVGNS
jgi:hypothetical protein